LEIKVNLNDMKRNAILMKVFYWVDVIGLWYYIGIPSCCRACHWSHNSVSIEFIFIHVILLL